MSSLFTREMSVACGKGDLTKMGRLLTRFGPLFFFIAAFFSMFVVFNPGAIANVIGGEQYREATWVIAAMAFYPIYQTYGQLGGAVLLASDQTTRFRNLGSAVEVVGFLLTLLLVAPKRFLGMDLGALGLGIKMVTVQCLSVNMQLAASTKYLKLPYAKFLAHQAATLGCLGILALTANKVAALLPGGGVARMGASGVLYSLLAMLAVFCWPRLVVRSREEIAGHFAAARARLVPKRALELAEP